jgi:hypothetical protein
MKKLDIKVKTEKEVASYSIREKERRFHIYKLSRSFFGWKCYRKMAEARTQSGAFQLIHVLAAHPITNMEVKVA